MSRTPRFRLARLPVLVAGLVMLGACGQPCIAPARPALPAVAYVSTSDPAARVALTANGVDQVRARDEAWRAHVSHLEAIIGQQSCP